MKYLKDIYAGIVLFLFGVYVYMTATNYPSIPSKLPKIIGVLLIILSSFLIARDLRGKKYEKNEKIWSNKVVVFILLITLYIIFIIPLGFLISSLIFMGCTYYYLGFRSFKHYIFGFTFMILINYLVVGILKLRLPVGLLTNRLF